jgi:hypothetical protein
VRVAKRGARRRARCPAEPHKSCCDSRHTQWYTARILHVPELRVRLAPTLADDGLRYVIDLMERVEGPPGANILTRGTWNDSSSSLSRADSRPTSRPTLGQHRGRLSANIEANGRTLELMQIEPGIGSASSRSSSLGLQARPSRRSSLTSRGSYTLRFFLSSLQRIHVQPRSCFGSWRARSRTASRIQVRAPSSASTKARSSSRRPKSPQLIQRASVSPS